MKTAVAAQAMNYDNKVVYVLDDTPHGLYEQVAAIATGAQVSGGAEAVLIPDTAMHSLQWIDRLEAAVGLPVLTANQVTVWQGMRLLGDVPRYETLGTLFRTPSRG